MLSVHILLLDVWDIVNHDMVWLKNENESLYKNSTVPEFLESSKNVPDKRCVLVEVRQTYEETGRFFRSFVRLITWDLCRIFQGLALN